MVLLGLLLVILAVAAGVALFLGTQPLTSEVEFEVGVLNFVFTPLQLLIAGAAVMLLLALGLSLIRGTLARKRRARQQAKDAQRQAELEESIRADERTRADEAHRSELAERERTWESEREERDRAREEDFESRRAELEQRIRLDERSKVEREVDRRHAYSNTGLSSLPETGGAGSRPGSRVALPSPHGRDRDGDDEAGRGRRRATATRTPTPVPRRGGTCAASGRLPARSTPTTGHDHDHDHDHDVGLHHDGDVHELRHADEPAARLPRQTAAGGVDDSGTERTQRLEHGAVRDDPTSRIRRARDALTRDRRDRRPVEPPGGRRWSSRPTPGERTVADRLMGRDPERGLSRSPRRARRIYALRTPRTDTEPGGRLG